MIGYLRGRLTEKTPDSVIVDVNGVGYEVSVPLSNICILPLVGHESALFIHTHVREDSIRLFGFASLLDRKVFETLIGVTGVGPKLALQLLGPLSGQDLCEAISAGRLAVLTSIPGVGAKTAERLVLELKSKLQKLLTLWEGFSHSTQLTSQDPNSSGTSQSDNTPNALWAEPRSPALERAEALRTRSRMLEDLRSGLANLGYKDKQISEMSINFEKRLDSGEPVSLENALRDALRKLSGHLVASSH